MSDHRPPATPQAPTAPVRGKHYKYYDLVMAGFVVVLLCSNLIGPGKSCAVALPLLGTVVFGAGNLFFPISYIFDDVITEVYGYARNRKVIWAGFGAMLFASTMAQAVIHLPVDPKEKFNEVMQPALEVCFGNSWRIVIASIIAFWAGDFANSFVLAKMKILTRGRWLWTRTIGSTIVGEGLDSLIFYPIALTSWAPLLASLGVKNEAVLHAMGGWSTDTAIKIIAFNWFFKVAFEVVMTPVTYAVCNFLKRAENENFYDVGTNFTPFSLKD